jgi:hypothetical protein
MTEFTDGLDDAMPTIPKEGKRRRGHQWMRELEAKLRADPKAPEDEGAQASVEGAEWPLDAGIPVDHEADLAGLMVANILTSAERTGQPGPKPAEVDRLLATAAEDMVHLPKHYARFKIEPIRFICENKLDFFQGNVVKYICRHDAKNGIEDIDKVIRYAQMYKKWLQGDEDWWK